MAMAASVGCNAVNSGLLNYTGPSAPIQTRTILLTNFYGGDRLTYTHTSDPVRSGTTLILSAGPLYLTETTTTARTHTMSGTVGAVLGLELLNLAVTAQSNDPKSGLILPGLLGTPTDITVTVTCTPAPSPTTLVVTSNSPTVFGQNAALAATITAADGLVPNGNVTFTVDGVAQAPVALNGSGVAKLNTAGLSVGNHTVSAAYAGNSSFTASGGTLGFGHTVNKASTTTSVTSSAASAAFGSNVTFTATVAAAAPGSGTPTGQVIFSIDGVDQAASTLNGSGVATLSTSALSVANHVIAARYVTTTNYNASSGTLSGGQSITKAATTTAVTQSAATTTFGQSVTFTATLSSAAGTPTGSVIFSIDGAPQAPTALVGGVAQLATTSLAVGNHTISASYAGTASLAASSGTLGGGHAVTTIPTTTTVSGPGPVVYGNSATITATVAAASGTPGGSLVFTVDGVARAPIALDTGGASVTLSGLSAGTHTVSAEFLGSTNYGGSTGTLSGGQIVTKATTTTAISPVAAISLGQSLSLSATVSSAGGTPNGTVTFTVAGAAQDPVTLVNGQANLLVPNLPVGTHTVVATYSGADNFATSSANATGTVNKAASTLVVNSSANPAVTGQPISFTATASSSVGTPTGSVIFTVDGVDRAPITLSSGSATLNLPSLPVGSHTVSAAYSGNANLEPSSASLPGGQTVARAATTVSLSSDTPSPALGATVTFTAQVAPVAPGAGTPTGNVVFSVDGVTQAPVALSSGSASISRSNLGVGNHIITALYVGDTDFSSSSGTLSGGQTVNAATTSTVLNFAPANPAFGDAATLTATMSSSGGTPAGSVIFTVNSVDRAPVSLVNGSADLVLPDLAAGSYTLGARYVATTSYQASTATNKVMAVALGPTTTTVAANPASIRLGESTTISATVSAIHGTPSGTVEFRADGTLLGTRTLNNGTASLSTSALTLGSHTITVNYLGSTDHAASSGSLGAALSVLPATTTLVASATPAPSVFGQPVTLRATASAAVGTPAGDVIFTVDGVAQPAATMVNGVATLPVSGLEPGIHTVSASYAGQGDHAAASASIPGGIVVNKAVPTLVVGSSPASPVFGNAITVTATLTSPAGTPSGDVTFYIDGVAQTPITPTGGIASLNLPGLGAGTHSVEARFAGDLRFAPVNTTLSGGVTIAAATSSMALSAAPDPARFGDAVTITATVTSAAGTPDGPVIFTIDGQAQPPVTLNNAGVATITTSGLTVGPHTVTASYAAHGNFGASSATLSGGVEIDVATTTTAVVGPAGPLVVGNSAQFTATVSAAHGTPTGSVTFTVDGATRAPVTLVNGVATLNETLSTAGSHMVTATYTGSANYAPSSDSLDSALTVNKATSTLAVNLAASSEFGATLSVSAVASSTGGTPTGTVIFYVDSQQVGSGILSSGTATLTLPPLAVGNHTITAGYAGDLNFGPAIAPDKLVNIAAAATQAAITSSAASVSEGQPVTFNVTVRTTTTNTPAVGDAVIRVGVTNYPVTLVNGAASLMLSTLPAGDYPVRVDYAAQGNFASSFDLLDTDLTVTVPPSAVGVTASLPRAVSGAAYTGSFTAYGGVPFTPPAAPYQYTVTAGALPAGLSLNANTGALTGTLGAAGNYAWTITATAAAGQPGVYPATLTVLAPATITLPASLPNATYGVNFAQSVAATGGTAPLTYAVSMGALPQGVSLNTATGALTGAPTQLGDASFIITATDANLFTGSQAYTVTVIAPTISVSGTTPNGTVNAPYSATVSVTGGATPRSFSADGTLPPGLSVNAATGALTGTPTTAGTYTFGIIATDANGFTGRLDSTMTIVVQPTIVLPDTLAVPRQNRPYSQALAASGGTPPYAYAISSGALPPGLGLNPTTGRISGTPTSAGSYTFTVRATDPTTLTGTHSYTLNVQAAAVLVVDTNIGPITAGEAFDETIGVTGGNAPYSFATLSGSLPTGITLNPTTGRVSGTTLVPGTYNLVLDIADADGDTVTTGLNLQVVAPTITVSASFDDHDFGDPASGAISASGGTVAGSYSYAAAPGTLPNGVSVGTDGVILGTSTVAGTFNTTITATDDNGFTGTATASFTITAPTLSLSALPATFMLTKSVNASVSVTNGRAPYAFVVTGNLPAGLALHPTTGVLIGTPTTLGIRSFTVTATDADGFVATRNYTVEIVTNIGNATLPGSLPPVTAGTYYSASVAASGGAAPLLYAVTTGTLPAGIALDPNTGAVSGTTLVAGNYPITVTVTGADGRINTASYTLVVSAPTIAASGTLDPAVAGTPYSDAIGISGGEGPYGVVLLSGALPTGLGIDNDGLVEGTPTVAGTFNFTVTITDDNGFTADILYSLTVAAPVITLSSGVPAGRVGQAYVGSVTATGGVAPRTYAVTTGTLPNGLALNGSSGALTGTPTAAGSTTVTITATDGNGFTAAGTYEFVIATNMGTATLGSLDTPLYRQPYGDSVAASGGTAPYSYAVTTGALPTGLILDSATGAVTGTPTVTGSVSFTITATDGAGLINQQTYNLVIAPPTLDVSVTPPAGKATVAYPATTVTATGGRAPYTFAIADQPPGIVINATTGVISGTPATPGTYNFNVTATDADGFSVSERFPMVIGAAPITLNLPADLPDGVTLTPYSVSLAPDNAVGAVTYSVTSGSLPVGLSLNTTTGVISGTPVLGNYTFSIRAEDANGNVGTASYGVTVSLLPPLFVPTTVDLDASATAVVVGESLVVTAEVSTAGGNATNGLVTLRDTISGAILGANAIGLNGTTSFTIDFATAANRTLAADYSGGVGFAASSGTGDTITVTAAPTTVTLSGTTGTVAVLGTVVLVANVTRDAPATGPAGAGNIIFSVDGTDVLTVPAILGSGTYLTTGLQPGQHTIRARFVSTSGADLGSFAERVLTVTSPTLTVLTAPLGDILFGQSPTFTATVTPLQQGVPLTGNVVFRDNGTVVATIPINGNTASHTLITPALGLHLVTAQYVGDTYYNGSAALGLSINVLTPPVGPILSTTVILASSSTPEIGEPLVLTATVEANGVIIPTGVVTFINDTTGMTVGTAPLNLLGVATLTLALTDGTPTTFSAHYPGDMLTQPSSDSLTVVPTASTTLLDLTAASATVLPGDPVELTANVRRQAGGLVDAGTLVFLADGVAFAHVPTNGSALVTATSDPIATSTVFTAEFIPGPSSADTAAQSSPVTVTAAKATPTISASANILADGSAVGTITIVPPTGVTRTPTGTVLLRTSLTLDRTLSLVNGVVSFSYPPGTFSGAGATFNMDYSGDALFTPASDSTFALAAGMLATQTTVTPSASQTPPNTPVTATIAVTTGSVQVDEGTVDVYDDGVLVGTVPVADGEATISLTTLALGPNVITANYLGTLNFAASNSPPATVTVTPLAGVLSVSLQADSEALFSAGQTITVSAVISANGAPANNLTVSSSGLSFSCPSTSLGNGQTITCSATYRVTDMDMARGRVDFAVTIAADGVVPVQASLSLRSEAEAVSETFEEMTDSFVSNRARVLGSVIPLPNIFNRRRLDSASRPGTVQASATDNSQILSFTSSLAEWRSYAATQAAEGMALGTLAEPLPVNIWIDAQLTMHATTDDDPSWGQLGTVAVGADFLVNENFLAGVMIQGDWASESTSAGMVSGTGFLVGPYVSLALSENLSFDATVLYGQSSNTASADLFGDSFSGDFDTTRLMAKAALTGYFEFDELLVRPDVTFFLGSESIGAYTVTNEDGDAVQVPGGDILQYRLTVGTTLEYEIALDNGATLTPMLGFDVGVAGNLESDKPNSQTIVGGISAGVEYETDAGLIIGLEFSTELDSGGFSSAEIRASIKGRF